MQTDAAAFFGEICRFLGIRELTDSSVVDQRVNTAVVVQRFWLSAVLHRLSSYTQLFKRMDQRFNRIEYKKWAGRHRSEVSEEVFHRMMGVYEDDVHQLETILGRDLSHWFEYDRLDPAIRP